ncbi:TPA: aminoacyl-tRNA hydrolase [Candidatus Collierbacteria bacterium]|uniref:Peptidyl-tRNA hydrolase n=1 Tax=Candidatus Collierbacteria bacterium GW2011_GWB2_44_22 TaxID=1618387 RepID=A0A0G1HXH3_9BACT|nr:MAG: Peptidyl-tRNA hydrolase [Candidatus Collierbacteria bacterium GW2011_GWA2_44_13]KKT49360.1 MAG: Peptidyl-tRNA hydrolase [Candidatus Collierbacteria bacterium GW2011_GWB1_44_197]KKT51831.1 MAG: Peptidyl-tRNA hydrolase [Candidatus Collierbacteria bacterium GW2011_GWB2_44_22]KKT61690.1 MAG: Peptidyl-tRNA hydrolase [Candidatus Collierbacteria bacterium GW2011_GWD1_44_27]KKT68669.1 MAG: Peptidyl-tRNA hydrolase [Microgenomates group bacterium GW2011_GWC1_44_37]KKT87512.1 MAG: Peptidyl-tRNA h
MKLVVGLGNPGNEYVNTRHNAGFMFVDRFTGGVRFSLEGKFEALIYRDKDVLLVKPQTFMNESGRAVRKIVDFYKLGVNDLILVHDDLDLKLGEYKIQKGVGPKVHNGVSSVEASLPDKNFLRLRIGIDNRDNALYSGSGADYVLGKLGKGEQEMLDEIMEEAADELLVALGLDGE